MRIKEIHIYAKTLSIVGGAYTMAEAQLTEVETTIIKIISDTGLVGWGEVCPLGSAYQPEHFQGVQAALKLLAPKILGEDILKHRLLYQKIEQLLNGHNSAKAGIDIAIHDLLGKHFNMRVCDLLGGTNAEYIPAYYALGIGKPNEIAQLAKEKIQAGYKRLQLKIGGRDINEDIEVIHHVWKIIKNKASLIVDANRSMTMQDTIKLSLQCHDIPLIIEQPCNTIDEIAMLNSKIQHPIYLDENTENINAVIHAIERKCCAGFSLKITRLGGLMNFATIRNLCETRSMPITCDDTFGGDIIAAACVHGGASVSPKHFEAVWIATSYLEEHYDDENGIKVENGKIKIPDKAGLGITPNEDKIGKLISSF